MPETAIHVPVCILDPERGFLRGHIDRIGEHGLYHIAWEGGLHDVLDPHAAQVFLLDPERLGEDGMSELESLHEQVTLARARMARLKQMGAFPSDPLG